MACPEELYLKEHFDVGGKVTPMYTEDSADALLLELFKDAHFASESHP